MSEETLFPPYIARPEEEDIRRQLARVQEDGSSRVVLLYGPGGIGKTYLVREMARAGEADEAAIWLGAIDVDDPDYWLLSNLERHVATQLDPENRYFERHRRYLARLPDYDSPSTDRQVVVSRLGEAEIRRQGRETVVSHLGRVKKVFVDCYTQFVADTGKTVIIVFDTAESLRGTYLLVTLAQWMKALPSTLFILSGRPMPDEEDKSDPITKEFVGSYQPMPVERVDLREFTFRNALTYLNTSGIAGSLSGEEKTKLALLTRGHPLWLATAISYLAQRDMPAEADLPVAEIEELIPYSGPLSRQGKNLQEAFKRRLVAPYRESDFWHEAVKRLAVLRQAVNLEIWRQIMADCALPHGVPTMQEAWRQLMHQPWIRPRVNRRYVTLHDAMAEELAQRIIPMHDENRQWRCDLWRQAMDIYRRQIEKIEPRLREQTEALDDRLRRLDVTIGSVGGSGDEADGRAPAPAEVAFIRDVAEFDAKKRELDQFRAVRLFYQLLSDFDQGCQLFLTLFEETERRGDFYAQEMLALEMHRFLPGGTQRYALGDVVGSMIDEFREWLPSARPDLYREIGIRMAAYLIKGEQAETAFELLRDLPAADASGIEMYRMNNLCGNACMRIPGQVRKGESYFRHALEDAVRLTSGNRQKLIAEAHKELGFYFRNEGKWKEADEAYQHARDAISEMLLVRDSDEDREEMASIHTNWAYVKGLNGYYRDGSNLVESAIAVRHRLNKHYDEGISWSVCGEVYRYERRFRKAWDAYSIAEQIFHGERSWTWLGVIYQEQAICIFQAMQDRVNLVDDPLRRAKRLITLSLDICRDQAVRNYPSALNRAGRIFGVDDPDLGLGYLLDGIDWARRLSDGWFWFANLVEYVELCYRAWVESTDVGYIDRISARESDIVQAMEEYEFPDLRGRWYLIQAHLDVRKWFDTQDDGLLESALQKYREGFALIAQAYVGSSGAAAIPSEFATFAELFAMLPARIQSVWQIELRNAWRGLREGSTMLLARLEALH